MQISVDIWALCDKVLRDDPNESSAVYLLTFDNKHAVVEQTSRQINFFAENISDVSSLWRRLSITHQATKKIKFHRCSFLNIHADNGTRNKCVQILFFNNQIIFFVIPKVCLTVCVLHFLNLESLKRIYASLFTFRDKF